MVQETGKKFWSTKDPGQQPFSYQAGVGQVIKGWDQGLLGMKLGEERQVCMHRSSSSPRLLASSSSHLLLSSPHTCCWQVVIPGHEGYGPQGFPAWGIPPNGTLDFTLEVLAIK